ncbi:MAG: hypothetical protein R2816_01025 [Flavobacteriaceae bacterium]|jgi:hypothetical protein|nr:hypothetical protein [Flavobacteriaceae bacterium]
MRKWIAIIVILVIVAFLSYHYIYQDHRDIESETAVFTITAKDITNEFEINSSDAETKYLNKTIVISGIITELSSNQITVNDKVFCQLVKTTNVLKPNQKVTLKGRFIGYDNLLDEIKLDQCYIIN